MERFWIVRQIATYTTTLRLEFVTNYSLSCLMLCKLKMYAIKWCWCKNLKIIAINFSKAKDKQAAKCFFKKALRSIHVAMPRVITIDKNLARPTAIEQLIN